MREPKNPRGPDEPVPPGGPDGKAGSILPGAETMIRAELVGGPLDGAVLDLEDSSPTIHVPAAIVQIPVEPAGESALEVVTRIVGADRRNEWNEYALDRVGCEGTSAFFRFVRRSR